MGLPGGAVNPRRIAIVGFGHIGRTRHLPILAAGTDFKLVAIVDAAPVEAPDDCRVYRDHLALLADAEDIDAVAICTPPGPRSRIAADALLAGKHVLLEKPAAASLGDLQELVALAARQRKTLFAAWHSHFSLGVLEARHLLASRQIKRLHAIWHEDVERWHAGQAWIWEPKGFGVFDTGSNAISILTKIAPETVKVEQAEFLVEHGRDMPIAAHLALSLGEAGGIGDVDLDWRAKVDRREIEIECRDGMLLHLTNSGRHLHVDGQPVIEEENFEYPRLYTHFRRLIEGGASEVDFEPLRVVADAFLLARRRPA
jgi:predicted dehydrogenase